MPPSSAKRAAMFDDEETGDMGSMDTEPAPSDEGDDEMDVAAAETLADAIKAGNGSSILTALRDLGCLPMKGE